MNDLRIHITPNDCLADIDEMADGSEPRSRCRYYIEPDGLYGLNEVCEANYYTGNRVPYHEHAEGFETFLVDGGAIEITSRSRKAVARKGDIVHITPYTPHSVRTLENESIWRAFHQGIYMVRGMIEERRMRDLRPDIFNTPAFKKEMAIRHKSVWFDYQFPEAEDVPVEDIREIRPFDFSLAEFEVDGINLKLKVGRWETAGAKEVWQLTMKKGSSFRWAAENPHDLLYDVFSGAVDVKLDGLAPFTANARDLIHIPKFGAGSITALEDAVLFDVGCQSFMMRFMDELHTYKIREPEKFKDESFVRELMQKHDCCIFI